MEEKNKEWELISIIRCDEDERISHLDAMDEVELENIRSELLDILYNLKETYSDIHVIRAIYSLSIYITEGIIDKKVLIEQDNDLCVLLSMLERDYGIILYRLGRK